MKLKFCIFVLFILLASIYGGSTWDEETSDEETSESFSKVLKFLNELASDEDKSMMSGTPLKLKENGFLREFGRVKDKFFGFFYKGTIPEDNNRPVAIKFTPLEFKDEAEKEFHMHYYLKAYENEAAEEYGIPVVYFFGLFGSWILTAFTMFDMGLQNSRHSKTLTQLDELILLRDFVFQSKYIHSLGIRLDNLRPENIVTRRHQSFLFGFNGSSKMVDRHRDWSKQYGYRTVISLSKKRAIDDYESFLYMFSAITGKYGFDSDRDGKKIKEGLETDTGSERIIKAFAEQVWPTNGKQKDFPDYKSLVEIINLEIAHAEKISPHDIPGFSWEKSDAETSARVPRVREIENIADPKYTNSEGIKYPPIPEELRINLRFSKLIDVKGLEGAAAEKSKKLCKNGIAYLKNLNIKHKD